MKQEAGKSRWGKGIAALYISFVVFILACVGFATLQNYDLVETDYYDKGVAYQGEIDRHARTDKLTAKPSVSFKSVSRVIVISFPAQWKDTDIVGVFNMMRPSDAALDSSFTLVNVSSGFQIIDASSFAKGLWRTSLIWSLGGVDYAIESMIVVE